MLNTILSAKVVFDHNGWQHFGSEVKTLVSSMLSKKPQDRPTATQILSSQWFKTYLDREIQELDNDSCSPNSKSISPDKYIGLDINKFSFREQNEEDLNNAQMEEFANILERKTRKSPERKCSLDNSSNLKSFAKETYHRKISDIREIKLDNLSKYE